MLVEVCLQWDVYCAYCIHCIHSVKPPANGILGVATVERVIGINLWCKQVSFVLSAVY